MSSSRGSQATIGTVPLCGASFLLAQSGRGAIPGTVRGTAAALIPQAKIIITNTTPNVAVNLTTGAVREYAAASVPVALYTVQKKG